MLWEYLCEPEEYYLHHMRFSNSVVMMVCFGRRTEKGDVFLKEILDQFGPVLKAMRPGTPSPHLPQYSGWESGIKFAGDVDQMLAISLQNLNQDSR